MHMYLVLYLIEYNNVQKLLSFSNTNISILVMLRIKILTQFFLKTSLIDDFANFTISGP